MYEPSAPEASFDVWLLKLHFEVQWQTGWKEQRGNILNTLECEPKEDVYLREEIQKQKTCSCPQMLERFMRRVPRA